MMDTRLSSWLLDSDPAQRCQLERDLLGDQDPDGHWAGGA